MTLSISSKQTDDDVKVLLTLFSTAKDWPTCVLHEEVRNLDGTVLPVQSQGQQKNVRVNVIFLPRSYQGIEERIEEIYNDRTWHSLVHFVEGNMQGSSLQFAKGAERMGYNQVDADGRFAPMISPLRGTRGLEGKGRKWHTSTDIDGLMKHLAGVGHDEEFVTACENPGLGLPGYLFACSLRAHTKQADPARSVTCIMSPASGADDRGKDAASPIQNLITELCKWLAQHIG